MNFRVSLVSDEEEGCSISSKKLDGSRVPKKSPSGIECRKFRSSRPSNSFFDSDDEEEDDDAVLPFFGGPSTKMYSEEHATASSRVNNTKRSVLDKLACIGSQKAAKPIIRREHELVQENEIDYQSSIVRPPYSCGGAIDSESEIDFEKDDLECSEKGLVSDEDTEDESDVVCSEEDNCNTKDKSPLQKLLARQASMLDDFRVCVPKKKAKKTKSEILKSASGPMSIEEYWDIELRFLAPDFFRSKEAKMEITTRVRKGVRAYEGLRITHENSYDMKAVYEVDFAPAIKAGQDSKTYEQFKVTVGQYARMCVTLKKCKAKNLCEPGTLFRLICEKNLAEAFLGYFQIRGAPATVTQKANTLVRLADSADLYFRSNEPEFSARAEMTARFIRKTSSSQKRLTRHRMKEKQDINRRMEEGRLFTEEDFSLCSKRAAQVLKKCLPSIKKYVKDYESSMSEKNVERQSQISFERQISSLVNKWCINFMCLLIVNGAGQRPQVYAELTLPSYTQVKSMRSEAAQNGYFELSTIHEKTTRNIDCPYVIFPASTFPYLSFHVRYVRDIIVRLTRIDESRILRKTLLLHTVTGFRLDSGHVTRTLKLFMGKIDPERSDVSTMTLRASYATMMLQKYRAGEVMTHKTEEQFLEYLSKVMNTSVEQLSTTYASSSRASFGACAREVANIMDSNRNDRFAQLAEEDSSD